MEASKSLAAMLPLKRELKYCVSAGTTLLIIPASVSEFIVKCRFVMRVVSSKAMHAATALPSRALRVSARSRTTVLP